MYLVVSTIFQSVFEAQYLAICTVVVSEEAQHLVVSTKHYYTSMTSTVCGSQH